MFPRRRRNYFPKTGKYFHERRVNQKAMVKILARKLILCELPGLHYKYKNKRKKLWVKEMFEERQSKEEFHVLVKKLKLFDHGFFFKDIGTQHFDFSQRCLTVFLSSFNRLYTAILLVDNTPIKYLFSLWSWIFPNSKTKKEISVQGKEIIVFLVGALKQSHTFFCSRKISEVDSGIKSW